MTLGAKSDHWGDSEEKFVVGVGEARGDGGRAIEAQSIVSTYS